MIKMSTRIKWKMFNFFLIITLNGNKLVARFKEKKYSEIEFMRMTSLHLMMDLKAHELQEAKLL
jgi:hypothetical protein